LSSILFRFLLLLSRTAGEVVPPVPDPRRGCAQPWSYFDSKVWNVSVRLEHDFTDWLSGQIQVLHSELERSEVNSSFGYWAVDANGNGELFDYASENGVYRPTSYRASLNARFDTGPVNHDLIGGFMATDYETNAVKLKASSGSRVESKACFG
jgi:iron complex outermembrane receptor protein